MKAWRFVASSYQTANRVTHHALSWFLFALLILYFIFCGVFLSLRYVVLPNIDNYKPEVEKVASYFIDRPVSIGTIHASWRGLRPNLALHDVVIHNQQGEQALVLPEVAATFSWWSMVVGEPRLYALEVSRPDLEIERAADGKIYVAGILLDTQQQTEGRGLNWMLAQREIVIRNGWVRWRDEQRKAPELVLTNVDFLLQNQWRYHRAALQATPPASLAAPLDLRADFRNPAFAKQPSDFSQWTGELYADWRNTDLQAWKQYIDYPFELSGGVGALRAWLKFDRGVVANFTADMALTNLSLKLGPDLSPLNLVEVSGRISAGEVAGGLKDQLLSFGEHGHALTLTNFSLRTDQGAVLPSTTVSHIYTAATRVGPEQHALKITDLDLEALAQLAAHLPLSTAERQMLSDFAPRGKLHNFSAAWEGSTPSSNNYRVSGEFLELALKSQKEKTAVAASAGKPARAAMPALPGFEALTGNVEANQDGGTINLNGKNLSLDLANYFPDPVLPFEDIALRASWSLRERDKLSLKISSMEFTQGGIKGSLEGTHVVPLTKAGKLGTMDLSLHFPSVELSRVARFMPSQTPIETRDWMAGAMLEGEGRDVTVVIKGDLDKFPFQPRFAGEKPSGIFKVTGKIENGKLSPAPQELASDKHTQLWPRIEDIRGNLVLDRTRIAIHADSAKTRSAALSNVDVVIPDYWLDKITLEVNGSASGPLQTMLTYVNSTPVLEWIGNFTEDAHASGNARLNLKMSLPLYDGGQPTVLGNLRFQGNEVQLMRGTPTLQQTNGELNFSDKGFQLNSMQGSFLGGPLNFNGGTQRDGSTQIRFDGGMTSEGLARSLPGQAIRKLSKKITGGTRYSAMLRIKNQRPELTLESSLAGLAMDLPAPLRKSANELMPLRFSLAPLAIYEELTQSEDIRINLGKSVTARYVRQRSVAKNAPWKLVRGGIGVNVPVPMPESGLAINLNVPSLSIDAWRNTVASLFTEPGTTESAAEVGAIDFSNYITPDMLGVRAAELIVADKKLGNAVVGASRQRGNWQVNIHSDQAVGYATWNDPSSERGAGKITARLVSLVIPKSAASDVSDLLSGKSSSAQLPGLDIVADNFELMDIKLGHLELAASNAGMSFGREWRINRLALSNPDASLRASGKWSTVGGENQSGLSYELDISDAGHLLDRFGFEHLLKGGKGKMEGELNWKGLPYDLDIPSLSGNLSLSLASGQFLKVDPGAAKLLGVMSLQSLPRRLVLDFRDLFSEGFAFDGIASTATITRGVIKTDSFKMRGVNALVLMDGTVDLADETQNMDVVVIPELNAGAASVVYGLAVNPVIGLGTFLAQLFLRNPLSQALTQEYQVTGPWKDPAVKKIPTRRKVATESTEENKKN
jgi:uncharacterized protein (TIGR02099 family)